MSLDGQIFIQGLQLEQADPLSVIVAEKEFVSMQSEKTRKIANVCLHYVFLIYFLLYNEQFLPFYLFWLPS